MTNFSAIQTYLSRQGDKYIQPDKAGVLKETMLTLKREGQEARLAFSQLAQAFQGQFPHFTLERVSNWANQAQVARPHFWVYLREEGTSSEPMFAFRVYGTPETFGISVEVSIIERKRDEESLVKQNRILQVPAVAGTYYQYLESEETVKQPATEEVRLDLLHRVEAGHLRKVLIKTDIPIESGQSVSDLLLALARGIEQLRPFYEKTRS